MKLYAVTVRNMAPSEYTGVTLRGLVEHKGKLYGITETTLVEYTGSDDDGTDIDCYVQTGKIGSIMESRYTRVYTRDRYANSLELSSIVDQVDADGTAAENTYSYTITGGVGAHQHGQVTRLRHDIKGTGWAWKIANVDGGGFVLKTLNVQPSSIEIDV